jgi:hypothetical protein
MLARSIFPVMAIAVLLSMQGQSLDVCWAESKILCPAGYNGDKVTFFACNSGGHPRFNPDLFVIRCAAPLTVPFAKL